MKKFVSLFLIFAVALSAAGCAKKTASEQLKDDMDKAAKEVKGALG